MYMYYSGNHVCRRQDRQADADNLILCVCVPIFSAFSLQTVQTMPNNRVISDNAKQLSNMADVWQYGRQCQTKRMPNKSLISVFSKQ